MLKKKLKIDHTVTRDGGLRWDAKWEILSDDLQRSVHVQIKLKATVKMCALCRLIFM